MDELKPNPGGKFSGAQEAAACDQIRDRVSGQSEGQTLAIEEIALPSFFIVGPPRTGSSWLHEVLSAHAALPSPSKETRFFDTHFQRGMKWYMAHYRLEKNEQRRVGEVAPTYFASTAARERMAQTVPEAKIVCVFRNPVERVVSLYRLKQAYGLIPWEFEEALERDPELMESSKYVSHLKLWRRSFGSDKILTLLYDDLRRSPQDFVNSLADFVSVPRFKLRRRQCELVHDSDRMTRPRSYYRTRSATLLSDWLKARQMDWMVSAFKRSRLQRFVLGGGPPFPKPSLEALAQLEVRLQPEIEQLETLIQRDLSAWKNRKAA